MYTRSTWPSLWDAFGDLQRLFDDGAGRGFARADFPAVNVWSDDDSLTVSAELPGVHADDLSIEVENDTLTIRGQRRTELSEDARILRRERRDHDFTRSIRLPFAVESDRAEARFRNGVLVVALTRHAADKPRRIAVTTA